MNFKKMLINFRKKVTVALLLLCFLGKEQIHKYMQYEVFKILYIGKIANKRKVLKWLPFDYKIVSP